MKFIILDIFPIFFSILMGYYLGNIIYCIKRRKYEKNEKSKLQQRKNERIV
jgi:hypothetical protein